LVKEAAVGDPIHAGAPWRVTPATNTDVADVAGVLEDASRWLRERGAAQWPHRFAPELVLPAIEAGQTWLVRADKEVVGTLTVDHDDPAWSDQPANAAYVHRMAVIRHGAALGTWLLAWVGDQAHMAGRDAVRLDCVANNTGLCVYYERHGFRPRGDVRVGGAPGERRASASEATLVRRYEKAAVSAGSPHES